eukprot:3791256-Pleurochrysis_carterae.AAC.1
MRARDRGTRGDSHTCGLRTGGPERGQRAGAGSGRPKAGRRRLREGGWGGGPGAPGRRERRDVPHANTHSRHPSRQWE